MFLLAGGTKSNCGTNKNQEGGDGASRRKGKGVAGREKKAC